MRKIATLVATLSCAFGCAGPGVGYDYDPEADFASLKTFDWMPAEMLPAERPEGGETPAVAPPNPLVDKRVRDAVQRELLARGLVQVQDKTPDFWVAHTIAVAARIGSPAVTTTIGVGSYGRGGGFGVSTGSDRIREYEEGTIIIDFVDARRGGLVWRGTGTRELLRNPKPEQTTALIDDVVAKIIAQYPPKPAGAD